MKETSKKNEQNKFYEMHAMYRECTEKNKKTNEDIEKYWIARMQCEINVMTNEREAAKFKVGSA